MSEFVTRSPRSSLRRIATSDLRACSRFPYSLSSVEPLTELRALRRRLARTRFWSNDEGALAIVDAVDRRLVGTVQFSRSGPVLNGYDIGYLIHAPEDRGKGFASDALRQLTTLMFAERPQCRRLQLIIVTSNDPSRRVAEACGYRQEGVLRQAGLDLLGGGDCYVYARVRGDP